MCRLSWWLRGYAEPGVSHTFPVTSWVMVAVAGVACGRGTTKPGLRVWAMRGDNLLLLLKHSLRVVRLQGWDSIHQQRNGKQLARVGCLLTGQTSEHRMLPSPFVRDISCFRDLWASGWSLRTTWSRVQRLPDALEARATQQPLLRLWTRRKRLPDGSHHRAMTSQVKIHGGPTGSAAVLLNLTVQYWTSRGWAIADVNYGESRQSTCTGRTPWRSLDECRSAVPGWWVEPPCESRPGLVLLLLCGSAHAVAMVSLGPRSLCYHLCVWYRHALARRTDRMQRVPGES